MGARSGVPSFLAVTCLIKQRFYGISLIIAICICGFAAVSTAVAQLQIKRNLAIQLYYFVLFIVINKEQILYVILFILLF